MLSASAHPSMRKTAMLAIASQSRPVKSSIDSFIVWSRNTSQETGRLPMEQPVPLGCGVGRANAGLAVGTTVMVSEVCSATAVRQAA